MTGFAKWRQIPHPLAVGLFIDWFRFNESHNIVSKFGKTILRAPIALFGAVSILIGSSIILWVLYNIFVERQSEYTGPSTILGGFGIGPSLIFFGVYMLRLAIKKQASKDNQELLIKPET